MKHRQNRPSPDAPPAFDDSEAFDAEKHTSGLDQSRPDRGPGFVPVDEAMSQGALFGEKVERTARDRHAASGEGAELSGEDTGSETEAALKSTVSETRKTSKFDDPAPEEHDDEDVEEALKESFPASDPPSYSPGLASPSYENGPRTDKSEKTP